MRKVRYEVDPHNRLIIDETGRKTLLPRFRKVLDGKFKVNKNNTLSYHVKAALPSGDKVPHQVKLRGKWSLTRGHDLRLTLDKWGRQTFGDQITLRGEIIGVNKNSLLFAVTTRTKEDIRSTYILNFRGSWQTDKNNRLTFTVKRERNRHDILTFNGAWEIDRNHRVIYRYETARLIRKSKKIRTLTFKGHWDIKGRGRISYVIDRNTNSVFNFKTGFGIFKDKYIKYEVGIGISRRPKPLKRTVTLFGKWKIKRNIGLVFEVKYEKGKISAIVFEALAKPGGKNTVLFRLRNDINKDIAASLKISRKILKGEGEIFIRGRKSKRESAVYAGAGRRW